jgi:hypothetical protein
VSKKSDAALDKFLADCVATLPEEKRAAAEEIFNVDGVKTKLKDGLLAREDYSRNMDDLSTSRQQLEAQIAEVNTMHRRNVDWYASANQEYATTKQKLGQYETAYGQLDGTATPPKNYMTKEELTAMLDEQLTPRDANAIDVADVLTDLKIEHRERFKEKLDSRALIKFATERRLPLDVAYNQYVTPKAEELRKTEFDAALAAARVEGATEALSKHNLPVLSQPAESFSYETNADTPKDHRARVSAAVASMNALSPH